MSSHAELPPALSGISRHLFLSPHYDDVPLSAGATVRLLADSGLSPETLIVFGSEPDHAAPLSAFAEAMHQGWGVSATDVIACRRAEEDAAAAVLGSRSSVLPFRDAIYRGDSYLSDDDLFGTPAEAEAFLAEAIVTTLDPGDRPDPAARFYAPLAVGRHVDHQIAFQAGQILANRGWDVWFYEDVPYALKPDALDTRLAEIAVDTKIEAGAIIDAGPGWERKIDAILRYPSQLGTVFREYVGVGTSRAEIDAALRAYATRVGDGVLRERFWRIPHAASRLGC